LAAFQGALDHTAEVLPPDPCPFAEFWRQAKVVLRRTVLRVPDQRRNVVHVLDAHEARQWELPVVFVCGMLEKQFPAYHAGNPILGDATRFALGRAGLWLRTSADRREEERFLFDMAASRATSLTVFTYPALDDAGGENLRSFFLGERKADGSRPVRPAGDPIARSPRLTIGRPDLLDVLRDRHRTLAPTAIESFLQCPFQFFARHTLKLEGGPARPGQRLDPLVKGSIAHEAVRIWHRTQEPMETILERVIERVVLENRIPPGYRLESMRIEMLRGLREFALNPRLADGWVTESERGFELPVDEMTLVRGRIDRCDVSPDGRAVVIDYKWASKVRVSELVKEHELGMRVQGGLYLAAVARVFGWRPEGMFYWSIREDALDGWHTGLAQFEGSGAARTEGAMRELISQAEQTALQAASRIRGGAIAPEHPDRRSCEWCECADACRWAETERAREAGGAG
jgi:ATP-dependent helicase/DNAse subunit B